MDQNLSQPHPRHPTLIGEWGGMPPWQTEGSRSPVPHGPFRERDITPLHDPVRKSCGERNITGGQGMLQPDTVLCGDAGTVLRTFPDQCCACCITSPPYWDTRYSGLSRKLGAEADYRDYIGKLVDIFREVRRTLIPSGTLWLVIGDTYASDSARWWAMYQGRRKETDIARKIPEGFKPKDLMGIPWRLAMALQDDGWYLRSDIIWWVPNHPAEPVIDRPMRAHDYVFLLAKSEQYAFNNGASCTRAHKTVWEIPTVVSPPISYAVFPEPLVERCMLAGSRKGDIVLDPFFGSGTVGVVAKRLQRQYFGIELNPAFVQVAQKRITRTK